MFNCVQVRKLKMPEYISDIECPISFPPIQEPNVSEKLSNQYPALQTITFVDHEAVFNNFPAYLGLDY